MKIWPFWPKGIKYHDQYLAETMIEDGVSTIFAYPDFNEPNYQGFVGNDRSAQDAGYRSIHLNFFTLFGKPVPYNIFRFAREIDKIKPNVIHIFGISNFTSLFALFSAKISSFNGKILFNDHSDPNERKLGIVPEVYRQLFRIAYHLFIRNRYCVIVPDDSARDELIRRYGKGIAEKIKIFPLGYDSDVFNFKPTVRKEGLPLSIGFAGKIFPPKRLELLIDVVREFPKNSIIVNIAGLNFGPPSEYQKSLMDLVDSIGADNIRFHKFIPTPDKLADFYSSIDVAVFPGSISITTFEANGCGCPVVVYESINGLHNRVSYNRGRLFRTREELVAILDEYLHAKTRATISYSSIAADSRRYSWQRLKFLYYQEYEFQIRGEDA